MSSLISILLLPLAEAGEEEANHLLSYGIGALALGILLAMLMALLAFGKGREHS